MGHRLLALALVAAPLAGCDWGHSSPQPAEPPRARSGESGQAETVGRHLATVDLRIGGRYVRAEVARTPAERERGLMFRRTLGESAGMLFVFPDSDFRHFYMKNTEIPLSIAFIASDGRITQIEDMKPFDLTLTNSREAVPYALEMPLGWFRASGVGVGEFVEGLERAGRASDP